MSGVRGREYTIGRFLEFRGSIGSGSLAGAEAGRGDTAAGKVLPTSSEVASGPTRATVSALATVSGVASTRPAMIKYFDRNVPAVEIITTKSYQISPNSGNREPIIVEPTAGCFGNSVGLRNPGAAKAAEELEILRREPLRALLNVSVSASVPEDFISLVLLLGRYADIIELNFSCPHAAAGYGASIGCDPSLAGEYMDRIRRAAGSDFPALIFPKLTPNTPDIGRVAAEVMAAGADGITAINTVGPDRYLEPISGMPLLNNALGGRGGKSGAWIFVDALAAVRRIREAVGPDVPLIGMGGVSTGKEAAAMRMAGADVVGIGSALGRVEQHRWPEYLAAVRSESETMLTVGGSAAAPARSGSFLRKESAMRYDPYRLARVKELSGKIALLELDGELDCRPGEYVFIWLPGVGEKPFSVALSQPLTFLVKARGPFTEALIRCRPGDTLFVRGVYGAEVSLPKADRAVLAAGGTGIAVLPGLAASLAAVGTAMNIYFGTTAEPGKEVPLQSELAAFGSFIAVPDDGVPQRVLLRLEEREEDLSGTACYVVGPEQFMARAAAIFRKRGADPRRILLSMERPSLCGVGMCGECACGDHLTCQYGTFLPLDFLQRHAPEVLHEWMGELG